MTDLAKETLPGVNVIPATTLAEFEAAVTGQHPDAIALALELDGLEVLERVDSKVPVLLLGWEAGTVALRVDQLRRSVREETIADPVSSLAIAKKLAPSNRVVFGATHHSPQTFPQSLRQLDDVVRRSPGSPEHTNPMVRPVTIAEEQKDDARRAILARQQSRGAGLEEGVTDYDELNDSVVAKEPALQELRAAGQIPEGAKGRPVTVIRGLAIYEGISTEAGRATADAIMTEAGAQGAIGLVRGTIGNLLEIKNLSLAGISPMMFFVDTDEARNEVQRRWSRPHIAVIDLRETTTWIAAIYTLLRGEYRRFSTEDRLELRVAPKSKAICAFA